MDKNNKKIINKKIKKIKNKKTKKTKKTKISLINTINISLKDIIKNKKEEEKKNFYLDLQTI